MTATGQATGGDIVVDALRAQGVDTVFGLPGIQLDPLFSAFHSAPDLRIVPARHEQGAAYMALGYAQSTGRPGVFAVVPGPGFLNSTAALATAYACGAPVIGLIGQIDSAAIGKDRGELHELVDQSAILAGLTRRSRLATDPVDIPLMAAEVFAQVQPGSIGPAALELPPDILAAPAQRSVPPVLRATLPPIDREAVQQAAELLRGARQPLIIVGGGAVGATAAVRRLATQFGIPVLSRRLGKGVMDDRSLLSIGLHEASRIWADVDVILAIGTRFQYPKAIWGLRPGQRVIRIELEASRLANPVAPEIGLLGDAAELVDALLGALSGSPEAPKVSEEALRTLRQSTVDTFERALAPQMAFIHSLRAILPEDGIVVTDYTQVGYVAIEAFPIFAPRTLITPGYQGTLGFGFATGLGAKIGNPDKAVLAIVGDGGFLFTATELAVAVQQRIGLVTVVFNDNAFGNVRRIQQTVYGGKVIASDLHNPDFVAFAESFGAVGVRVGTPRQLGIAVGEGFARDLPTVIEVPVSGFPDPWPFLFPATDR